MSIPRPQPWLPLLVVAALAAATACGDATAEGPLPGPDDLPTPPGAPVRWVSAYYVGYQRDLLPEAEVDFSQLTHLVVGRVTPTPSGGVSAHFDIDTTNGPAMARALSTRAHAAGKKAVLMLGGAGEHANFVSAASSANRAAFISNLLSTMDALGYDGLDVDWEPIEAADRAPLLALLQGLRAARPGMVLTIPVGWVNANAPEEVDGYYAQVAAAVDQVNLMSYDMAGDWDGWSSWHFAALTGEGATHPSSIDSSVKAYLRAGVPAAKLGMGIGFYGACWRGVEAPRVPLAGRTVSKPDGDNVLSYTTLAAAYLPGATRTWDDVAKQAYLSSSGGLGPLDCNLVSYEDAESIVAKGAYARANGLGGTIVWTIGQGHLPGQPAGSRDPLMAAVQKGFLAP